MKKKAFGTHEIAKICNVTPSTVGNWIEKKLIPTFKTGGGHRRVWADDLEKFLQKHNIPLPEGLQSSTKLVFVIVDDEYPIRKLVKLTLEKLYPASDIHEAVDGFEAGQKIAEYIPSLVVLDLKLPGINGLKVCESIRSNPKLKGIKVLAISGHNTEEYHQQALAVGADDFLPKPFDVNELENKIQNIMGKDSRLLNAR